MFVSSSMRILKRTFGMHAAQTACKNVDFTDIESHKFCGENVIWCSRSKKDVLE